MARKKTRFQRVVQELVRMHGPPELPEERCDPFAIILMEQVAYLATDEKRRAVFNRLRGTVGTTPHSILAADVETLTEITLAGGRTAYRDRAERMRTSAALVETKFDGDLSNVFALPAGEATKALMAFPQIGEPGAQRILLMAGVHARLALDSNGMRVLLRIGYGVETKSYPRTYRSVQAAAEAESPMQVGELQAAHLLLRTHGKDVCKNSTPRCDACALVPVCDFCGG